MKTTVYTSDNGGKVKIITNGIPRDIIQWWQLTESERERFDWIDNEDKQDSASFFRYKGYVYSLDEFLRDSGFAGYDASAADTFFSGILVKLNPEDDYETVIVARYYAMSAFETE